MLSDGTFFRVGGHQELTADVRVIAATNQDLVSRVSEGRFREDLFHRLNVIGITLPPLRERREDIPALAENFLHQAAPELEVEPKRLDDEAMQLLCEAPWPGNVRELENLCRRLTVLAPGATVTAGDLPPDVNAQSAGVQSAQTWQHLLEQAAAERFAMGQKDVLSEFGPDFERVLLRTALGFTPVSYTHLTLPTKRIV